MKGRIYSGGRPWGAGSKTAIALLAAAVVLMGAPDCFALLPSVPQDTGSLSASSGSLVDAGAPLDPVAFTVALSDTSALQSRQVNQSVNLYVSSVDPGSYVTLLYTGAPSGGGGALASGTATTPTSATTSGGSGSPLGAELDVAAVSTPTSSVGLGFTLSGYNPPPAAAPPPTQPPGPIAPEPLSVGLVGAGLVALPWARRLRKALVGRR